MYWDDPSIAGFASRAGWAGGDLALAVAIALATSSNDDAYDYRPPFGLPGHFVGLWGVDVDTFTNYDASLMRNPVYNAQAAHDLWAYFGKAWGLFPAYNSGAYRRKAFEAAVAVTQPSPTQYGFGLAGDDLDARGLASMASQGRSSVANLATVVGRL